MSNATLLGAVYGRFQTDGALASVAPGSPFLDEAPEGTDLPYVIVEHGGERPSEHTTEATYREDGSFTLRVYDDSLADAETIGTAIKAAFDEQTITLTNTVGIRCQRVGYRARLDRMRSSLTRRVYEVELPYEVWIERTY